MPLDNLDDLAPARSSIRAGTQLGAYEDQSYFTLCGTRANLGGSFSDVWERSVNIVYPSQATVASVVSSSPNDTAAGTGAQRVRVVGWNAAWQLDDDEIELAGTTAVNGTVKFWRIHSTRVIRVGSGGVNAGQVDVKLDTQFASIVSLTDNRSLGSHFTIPPDKTGTILNLFATAALGGGQIDWGAARLYARFDLNGPLIPLHEIVFGGGGPSASTVPRLVLPGPADLVMRALASGAGTSKRCASGYDVLLTRDEHRKRRTFAF